MSSHNPLYPVENGQLTRLRTDARMGGPFGCFPAVQMPRVQKTCCALLLLVLFAASAAAQNGKDNHPSNDPPAYCYPCVFYSGDYDNLNLASNALGNVRTGNMEEEVWVPFLVEHKVIVTGLFVNELFNGSLPGVNPTPYGIRKNVSQGDGGELVCSGTADATATPTGRQGYALVELTYQIRKLAEPCILSAGTYWINVEPQYPEISEFGALSDVEDMPPPHHFGTANILDQSFFNSLEDLSRFSTDFAPAAGSEGFCGGIGCDMFSVGVTGVGR